MLAQKDLAQNDTIVIPGLTRQRSVVASIATSSTTNAGAVFVIEVEGVSNEWVTIGLFNALTQLAANNLTGASQYGWADVPGVMNVRVRRTDANGGVGLVGLSVSEAGR